MRRPIKLTSAPEGIAYFRICDPEGVCHVVGGIQKVQRHIEQMPELIVTKMPHHWSPELAGRAVDCNVDATCKCCANSLETQTAANWPKWTSHLVRPLNT